MSAFGTVATLPLAPGTAPNCHYYWNHYDFPGRPAIIDPSQQNLWATPPKICETVSSIIDVDVEELIRLNPSLSGDNCVIEPGFSYCAEEIKKTKTCKHLHKRPLIQRLIDEAGSSPSETTSPEPPICTFDPEKGEYDCPDPPFCRFDSKKGGYVCPKASPIADSEREGAEERAELR